MAAQPQTRELDRVVLLPEPVAAPFLDALRRRENSVKLVPRAPVGLAGGICAEEEEFRHCLYPGGIPKIGCAEYGGLLRDVGICRKPVLDEREDAEREGNRKLAVLVAADALRLDEFRELSKIAFVKVTLQAHEIEFLAGLCGREAQVIVEKAVGDKPRAVAEIGEELLGRAVGEVAARTIERKEVQEDSDDHYERQHGKDGERECAALHCDRRLVKRLVLAHLRHGEKPPVRHEIGGGERS